MYGYNQLPMGSNRGELIMRPLSETATPLERVRAMLVDRGYQEAITYSFVDAALLQELDADSQPVALSNPISSEMSVMRSSLWAGLIGALQYNISRQQGHIRIFESGLKFNYQSNEIKQNNSLAGVVVGELVVGDVGDGVRRPDRRRHTPSWCRQR